MGFPGTWMTESESVVYRVVPKCACSSIGQIMFYSDHGRFFDGDIHDSTTGEIIETALEVIASDDPEYLAAKRHQLALLGKAGRVITARAATIDSHGTGAILKANLGIG